MKKLSSLWLQELTWKEVEVYLKNESIVIVPIGST